MELMDILQDGLALRAEDYSPLVLAYIGDAVFEVYVRAHLIAAGNAPVGTLHRKSTHFVSAAAQSEMMREIEPKLSEEELAVFKRGRNAKSASVPKNANVGDYHRATGFEALVGFLYLKGQKKRILELFDAATKRAREELSSLSE